MLGANASRERVERNRRPDVGAQRQCPRRRRRSLRSTPVGVHLRQHVHVREDRVQLRDERLGARVGRGRAARARAMWRTSSMRDGHSVVVLARGWPARRRASCDRSSRRRSRPSPWRRGRCPPARRSCPLPNLRCFTRAPIANDGASCDSSSARDARREADDRRARTTRRRRRRVRRRRRRRRRRACPTPTRCRN